MNDIDHTLKLRYSNSSVAVQMTMASQQLSEGKTKGSRKNNFTHCTSMQRGIAPPASLLCDNSACPDIPRNVGATRTNHCFHALPDKPLNRQNCELILLPTAPCTRATDEKRSGWPAKAVDHRFVDIFRCGNAILHDCHRLPPGGTHDAIADKT